MEIASIVLQSLLALIFLSAGATKIAGMQKHRDSFVSWRLPQWFRIVTGIVELAAAVLLIVGYWDPSWAAVGALVLSVVGIGGIVTHARVKDPLGQTIPIAALGIIAFVLLGLEWSALGDFPGFE